MIDNWTDLIAVVTENSNVIFQRLREKINQYLRPSQRTDEPLDLGTVKPTHLDMFNNYKLMYEQLLLEDDASDIYVEMQSPGTNTTVTLNIVSVGKWIKIHGGNASRIFFFDEEKTMISDKSIADFLNRMVEVRPYYKYFSQTPIVYYKFRVLPDKEIIDYLAEFGVVSLSLDQKTELFTRPPISLDRILLDQTILMTLCSNLSYGLSNSFYGTVNQSGFIKTRENMIENKIKINSYLQNKDMLVTQSTYDNFKQIVERSGGLTEKTRFKEVCASVTIVPDETSPRFKKLYEHEIKYASVAERENIRIATCNMKLAKKLNAYYPEIPYELFDGAQLVEAKFA